MRAPSAQPGPARTWKRTTSNRSKTRSGTYISTFHALSAAELTGARCGGSSSGILPACPSGAAQSDATSANAAANRCACSAIGLTPR